MPATLLLVDDHALFRTGLRLIVQDHPDVGTIAEAGSIVQACELRLQEADLVLLDIQLPGMSGLDGLRLLRQSCPRARIVLVSASMAPDAVRESRARGADGFLPKSARGEDILNAITLALAGLPCFPSDGAPAAADGPLKGILAYTRDKLVSIDLNHDPHSSTFALDQTKVIDGDLVRVMSWYDNEWGFSNRMADTAVAIGRVL